MMPKTAFLSLWIVAAVAMQMSAAQAFIGGVGSGEPSNTATDKNSKTPEPAENQARTGQEPMMKIDYNRNRVYFARDLSKNVDTAEKENPNTVYGVVAYYPSYIRGSSRQQRQRLQQEANEQVAEIRRSLREQGIPDSRVRVSVKPYPRARGQETPDYNRVEIFSNN
jgi:hypothetical protein